MKKMLLIIFGLISTISSAQIIAKGVPISETLSANGLYKLKSISYDNTFTNTLGESIITHKPTEYSFEIIEDAKKINRPFYLVDDFPTFVAISNDGKKIMYITDFEKTTPNESDRITIYEYGKLIQQYTPKEFHQCDSKEKCAVFYQNDSIVYKNFGSSLDEFNDGLSEQEKFLNKNYAFNKNDTIYIIDPRKKVTLFDLNNKIFIKRNISFDSIYPKIKNLETVKSHITYYNHPKLTISKLENTLTNKKLSNAISEISNLKHVITSTEYHQYKMHEIKLSGYLHRDGKFEILNLEVSEPHSKEKIEKYIKSAVFKTELFPREVDKIYMKNSVASYRNFDDKIAKQETIKEQKTANKKVKN